MLEQRYQAETVETAVQMGLKDLNLSESEVKIEVINPGKKGFLGFGKALAEVNLVVIDPNLKKYESIASLKTRTSEVNVVESTEQTVYNESSDVKDDEEINVVNETVVPEAPIENIIETPVEEPVVTENKNTENTSIEATKNYVEMIIKAMGYEVESTVEKKSSNEILINLNSKDASRIIGKRGQILNSLQVLAQNYLNQLEKGYSIVTLDIENYRAKRRETLQTLALNMSKKAIKTNKPVKFEPMPSYERKIMHQILANIENIETYSEGREPHRYLVIKAR